VRIRRLPAIAAAAAALAVPAVVPAQQPPYEIPPSPVPTPAPRPAEEKPPLKPLEPIPALRRAVLIEPVRGKVTFQLPDSQRMRRLRGPTAVPMHTIVDAEAGRVRLTVERDTRGNRSRGIFYGGRFQVAQGAGRRPLTHLRLAGEFDMTCDPARASASAASKKPRRRRLWGDGKGRFRTRGFYSAATVRGTKWLVEDRCDGTLTRVVRGIVDVDDFSGDAPAPEPGPAPTEGEQAPAVGGPPPPAASPQQRDQTRRVRVRRGGSYVAKPGQ
jgi:hypothetical protein